MLENPRSPRVKKISRLSSKSERNETGLFLLEGPQAVSEALAFRAELIEDFFVTPSAAERYPELYKKALDLDIDVEFVTEEVLAVMADTVTPQGFVSTCRQFLVSVKDIFAQKPKLIAILEEVRDPGNAGTLLRAADSAGADAVIFTGRSVDFYHPKLVRSTTGSLFHLPVAQTMELDDVCSRAKGAGMTVIAADISGDDVRDIEAHGVLALPTAWVFGNEARGLTAENLSHVDRVVSVPIFGLAESLNLATAASVCLYQSAFAQAPLPVRTESS